MFARKSLLLTLMLALVVAFLSTPVEAQLGKLKKVQKKAEKKVEKKVDDKIDKKMDEAIDDALDGGSGDKKPTETAKPASQETKTESAGSSPGGGPSGTKAATMKPGEDAWANFDFIPGDQVLFYDDFSRTPTGDFPRRLELVKGNMEVAEWEGRKFLRITSHADFNIPLPQTLPERFTIEFDAYLGRSILYVWGNLADNQNYRKHSYVILRDVESGVKGEGGGEAYVNLHTECVYQSLVRCRIMGDGKYIKVYVDERRVANVPNADFVRSNKLHANIWYANEPVLLGNVRVAEGGKKILYEALMADGRVATQGIYFDSGSDRLRPESTPTLKEIGGMLKEHGDLKLLIEGHTDDVGDEAYNQNLSERRAASVRQHLVSEYGIDAGRLQSKGYGESKPVSPNTTDEGRQNNRRVELVKL